MDKKEKINISGKYRTIVKRANGKIEISEWKDNTIAGLFLEALRGVLRTSADFALDTLFDAVATCDPGGLNKDGIIANVSSTWYTTDCDIDNGQYTVTVTGVLYNVNGTVSDVALGFCHSGGNNDTFTLKYADPTSWNSIVLTSADELTIEWTITFS